MAVKDATRMIPNIFCYLIIIVVIVVVHIASSSESCVQEFGNCVMNRDCCDGLTCVTGDWQYTTDSTCLSPKSATIEAKAYTRKEQEMLVARFYNDLDTTTSTMDNDDKSDEKEANDNRNDKRKKSSEEINTLVYKKFRNKFPQLVSKLEKKYGKKFDLTTTDSGTESTTKTEDEL